MRGVELIDTQTIKDAARGRWPDIITTLAGVRGDHLDGSHYPCPKCGGTDRFRAFNDFPDTGGMHCNQCFSEKNGDGFSALQWLTGESFPAVKAKVADFLHVDATGPAEYGGTAKPKESKPPEPVDEGSLFNQFEEISEELHDTLFAMHCQAKPPITVDAIKAAGGQAVRFPKRSNGDNRCIAWRAVDDCGNVRGFILRRVTGDDFPQMGKLKQRKTHMLKGSRDGWVIPGGLQRIAAAEVVLKVEGVPDALAIYPQLPPSWGVITNICGAMAVPPFTEVFRDKFVVIIGDADKPGEDGARVYARKLTGIAAEIKVIRLPFEITEDSGKDLRDYLNNGGTFADLQQLIVDTPDWKDDGKSKDGRTQVILRTDEHEVIDEITGGLAEDKELYQRGGALVRIVKEPDNRDGITRPESLSRIVALQPATLREHITQSCKLLKVDAEGDLVPAHPTDWAVKGVQHRGTWPGIRFLDGVSSTPILRADGTILTTPGYDQSTGIYLDCGSLVASVPDNPTRDEAQEAALQLQDVFADFPFEELHHLSAAVAMVLTPFARQAFRGPAPLFLIDANVRGSGKSLLSDAVGLIVLGDDLPRMSNPEDDDEARKRITSLAIRGDSICLIDNIINEFGGAALDAALTSTRWQDRILGRSEIVDMPLPITWIGTGNNVGLRGDTARRICHIRLNCREERPEDRQGFRHADLRGFVRENRAQLVGAVLTILRAFHVAGRPQANLSGWGSYEGWSSVVRQAVVWLGLPDPAQGRIELMNRSDTQLQALRQLIECWHEVDPQDQGVTTAGLLDLLSRNRDGYHGVREALLEMCGGTADKLPGVRAVGNKLRHIRGRIIGGRSIDARMNRKNQQAWRVVGA